MKRVLDTSEVLGRLETPEGPRELCATAEASYDEPNKELIIGLSSFLRSTDLRSKETKSSAEWLPKPETLKESAGPEETAELAREVFHRWVQKVRRASPPLHQPVH